MTIVIMGCMLALAIYAVCRDELHEWKGFLILVLIALACVLVFRP